MLMHCIICDHWSETGQYGPSIFGKCDQCGQEYRRGERDYEYRIVLTDSQIAHLRSVWMAEADHQKENRNDRRQQRQTRYSSLRFTPEFVLAAAKFSGQVNVENPIPVDATIVECGYDFSTHSFYLKLRSDSFPEVGPNEPLPIVKAPTFSAVREELVGADMTSRTEAK